MSSLFPLQDYQRSAGVPSVGAISKGGRGVPDVSSDADPNSGYQVVVDGRSQIIGGTSAAASLWAGLFALLHEAIGPIGQPHGVFYDNPTSFREIRQGDNKVGSIGYSAGSGWDACAGIGSPNGTALLGAFKTSA